MRAALLLLTIVSSSSAQSLAPRPVQAILTGRFREPDLRESSGAAVVRQRPGVLFTINDSGNLPEIFATDSTGRALGRWRIPGVVNRDWEALTIGGCPAGSCFYIGDIGDNQERAPRVVVYRVRVPGMESFRGGSDRGALDLDSAVVRYPDGPQDAEAMWLGPTGELFLVSKGRTGGIKLYRVPASAFQEAATAELVQHLPIEVNPALGRMVTDASLAPDGRSVAIRTYSELYFFPLLPGGRLAPPSRICNLAGLEPQGEGLAWLDDRRLFLTSEAPTGMPAGAIHIVTCGG
jgi:hypothetical protein